MAKIDKYGLNIKQRKFADRYLINGNNAAEAYRFAYNPEADDKTATATGYKIRIKSAVKAYIEKQQEENQAIAEEKQYATREELIKFCTEIVRGERDEVDFTVETDSMSTMGNSSSTKTKRISKQWAADMLVKLLGADKGASANQNNVIIEEVD
jgi:phage terminase small subunit